ncbi:HAMP domain-containing histidine kinase [Geodermatophilus sabuli]|uniref:histidine kinase n=1 Tax=Geodermatophilus sabuli TaxID=1564158 RepID=A0A285EID4_9ACTN|nr:HAMP domain-containing histidine kinase [Geodermatophilus sabuli]MBB3086742.1 signal transduction histidine kinase [Geodermatophilus sabuli]SNX98882.1 Signal transduction histidine kinase [Geodermatophilus sabuli]
MTLAAHPSTPHARSRLLSDLLRLFRGHLHRPRPATPDEAPVSPEDAVVRALCHDMRTPLASLEAVLGSLGGSGSTSTQAADPAELLELARAQTAHLSSMLRTAAATGGAIARSRGTRTLGDVVRVSAATSGLPAAQLTVRFDGGAEDVAVADARVQRILANLLENAHRHGEDAPVHLAVTRRPAWVDLALTQAVARPERLISHLGSDLPPPDLTGLGLWSVRRQTRELGGRVVWAVDGPSLTLTVQLPDR